MTAAILAYLASRLDMAAAGRAVVAVDRAHLALVLVLVAADRAVMILRWILLLRASDAPVRSSRAAAIFLVSSFVGSFLPAGLGSDAARAYGLTRETAEGSEAVASVLVDRLLGVLSLALVAAAGLLAWSPDGRAWRTIVAALLVAVACLGAFWADRIVAVVTPARPDSSVARALHRVGAAVSRYRARGVVLAQVLVWSLLVQGLRVTQAYFLGAGLGLVVPFGYYLVFMPVGLLTLLLPVSVSGFGLPQGVIVWLLRPAGVADEQSFALSTLIVLTGLAGNLPGLLLWLRRPPETPRA
jgi:hypothetical protein